jgi:hypothetical protein
MTWKRNIGSRLGEEEEEGKIKVGMSQEASHQELRVRLRGIIHLVKA